MEVGGLYASIGYDTQAGAIASATGHFGGAVRNAGIAFPKAIYQLIPVQDTPKH
jgi:hypothetical protein